MRGLKILGESFGLFLLISIPMLCLPLLAPESDSPSNFVTCIWGILCIGSLAIPIWWTIIRLADPAPFALRLKQARWEYRKWSPWISPLARVTTQHIPPKKKKKRHPMDGYIDDSRAYAVRGSGIQRVQPILLAEGTYTVRYAFAGRCHVNVSLIHAIDRYETEMLNRVTGTGKAVISIPEDAYFFIEVHPYNGVLKSWKLVIEPTKDT